MAHIIFNAIWHWLFGWGGISLFVAIGAAAVWWFIPAVFTKVKALAFNVAIGALAFNSVYTMGYQNGASGVRAEWLAAEQRATDRGRDVRETSEREIPAVAVDDERPALCPDVPSESNTPGVVAPKTTPRARPAVPGWMRNDRHNRDNR